MISPFERIGVLQVRGPKNRRNVLTQFLSFVTLHPWKNQLSARCVSVGADYRENAFGVFEKGLKMFGPKKVEVDPDMEVFTVFDVKSGTYRTPILGLNRFDIIRDVERLMRDPAQVRNDLVTNAEDFQLFKVGEWFKKEGRLEVCRPEHIANFHEIKAVAVQREARELAHRTNNGPELVGPRGH